MTEVTEIPKSPTTDLLDPRSIRIVPVIEKPVRLQQFKEQLINNKKALSITLQLLGHYTRYWPYASKEEIAGYFQTLPTLSSLTPVQKDVLQIGIELYEQQHRAVQTIHKAHPDPEDLFVFMLGRKPKGQIEIREGPINFYFRCHDVRDYTLIYSQSFNYKRRVGRRKIREAEKSQAVFTKDSLDPALEGMITAERVDGKNPNPEGSFIHETQHAMMFLYQRAFEEYKLRLKRSNPQAQIPKNINELLPIPPSWERLSSLLPQIARLPTQAEAKNALCELLREERRAVIEREAKDELLAYIKQGKDGTFILDVLNEPKEEGGLYDSFDKKSRNWLIRSLINEAPKDVRKKLAPVISEAVNQVFVKEYQYRILPNAIMALVKLKWNQIPQERIINLFINEPLEKWLRTAQRIIESLKQTEPAELEEAA